MNEAERQYLPRFSAMEMDLYKDLFGRGAVPPHLRPAMTEWMPDWRAVARQWPPVLPARFERKR